MIIKKVFAVFILLFVCQSVQSREIPVAIKPVCKITTSNLNLQEGDSVNFTVINDIVKDSKIYIKKGEQVTGTIISIEDNDYLYKPATLYADYFTTKNADGSIVKLSGIIYKKGNDHWMITQFIPVPLTLLRGGEVQIKPKKDIFTLILKE